MNTRQMVTYSIALFIAGFCLGALCVLVPLTLTGNA